MLTLGLVLGCGGDEEGVSYDRQVRPLFAARCVPCHHSDSKVGIIDIEDPFTQDDPPGLVGSTNIWEENHPGMSAVYNAVPFEPDPETSFVMEKITNTDLLSCDPAVGHCRSEEVGSFMPPRGRLPPQLVADLRQWISDGAEDTDFYRTRVARIFGDPSGPDQPGSCSYCHYPDSPDPPDFTKMFDPVMGLVGVNAAFRRDLVLVVPGDPDASFLVMKVEAEEASSAIGSPMPRSFEAFSPAQVALIRQWIAEGARDN